MNKAYADLVRARAAGAIAEAKALRELNHDGLVGSLRETVLRQLLLPLIPANMGVASGIVTCHTGAQSSQIDLIIYDRTLLPALLMQETGLVPIEAALALIEVKSTLTLTELRKAEAMSERIGSMPMVYGMFTDDGTPVDHVSLHPTCAVFAFATDLAEGGMTEIERYEHLLAGSRAKLRNICVAGRGYWFARSLSDAQPRPPGSLTPLEWVPCNC